MKITIDTQVDTHEDIKKVLEILAHVLQKDSSFSASRSSSSTDAVDTTTMMTMFSQESEPTRKEQPDTPPDFSSYLNLTRNSQKKTTDDEPRVEFF